MLDVANLTLASAELIMAQYEEAREQCGNERRVAKSLSDHLKFGKPLFIVRPIISEDRLTRNGYLTNAGTFDGTLGNCLKIPATDLLAFREANPLPLYELHLLADELDVIIETGLREYAELTRVIIALDIHIKSTKLFGTAIKLDLSYIDLK